MKDYPLTDSEFMNIDEELFKIIQDTLKIDYPMNENPKIFDLYCEIRNNLCQVIHNKKSTLK